MTASSRLRASARVTSMRGRGGEAYVGSVHAEQMAEESPLVDLDTNALVGGCGCWPSSGCRRWWSPNADGSPHSILPASQVVRFLVPGYVQDDPSLARVMNESMADRAGDKLGSKRVRDLLPTERRELPVVNHDDTIIEVAAIMARLRCPLAAVMKDEQADRRDQRIPAAGAGAAAALTPAASPAGGGR